MGTQTTTDDLILELTKHFRVLTLGGVAVISHGLSRNTHDADIWLEPQESATIWANLVAPLLFGGRFGEPVAIGSWERIAREQLPTVIEEDGVIRVMGLNRPLDIFRTPNELPMSEFNAAWERAAPMDDGTRLPDTIDILMTKQETGRDKDVQDILYLEAKAEREYRARLPSATEAEAVAMLNRFLTPKVAECALDHPAEGVRQLATQFLRELAADGNPFARDIARDRGLA